MEKESEEKRLNARIKDRKKRLREEKYLKYINKQKCWKLKQSLRLRVEFVIDWLWRPL